jgi:hypothetical protein
MRRTVISLTLVGLLAACTGGGGGAADESTDAAPATAGASEGTLGGTSPSDGAPGGEPSEECAAAFEPLAEMELSTTSDLGDLPEVDATVEACTSLADWTAGAQEVVEEEINPNVVRMLLSIRCEGPSLSNTPICEELG